MSPGFKTVNCFVLGCPYNFELAVAGLSLNKKALRNNSRG